MAEHCCSLPQTLAQTLAIAANPAVWELPKEMLPVQEAATVEVMRMPHSCVPPFMLKPPVLLQGDLQSQAY